MGRMFVTHDKLVETAFNFTSSQNNIALLPHLFGGKLAQVKAVPKRPFCSSFLLITLYSIFLGQENLCTDMGGGPSFL